MLVICTLHWSSLSGAKDEAHQADWASVGGTMEKWKNCKVGLAGKGLPQNYILLLYHGPT